MYVCRRNGPEILEYMLAVLRRPLNNKHSGNFFCTFCSAYPFLDKHFGTKLLSTKLLIWKTGHSNSAADWQSDGKNKIVNYNVFLPEKL